MVPSMEQTPYGPRPTKHGQVYTAVEADAVSSSPKNDGKGFRKDHATIALVHLSTANQKLWNLHRICMGQRTHPILKTFCQNLHAAHEPVRRSDQRILEGTRSLTTDLLTKLRMTFRTKHFSPFPGHRGEDLAASNYSEIAIYLSISKRSALDSNRMIASGNGQRAGTILRYHCPVNSNCPIHRKAHNPTGSFWRGN